MSKNDCELSSLIIRSILDIEGAIEHTHNTIDKRLAREFNTIFNRTLTVDEWFVSEKDDFWESWFCPKNWVIERNRKPDAPAYFELDTLGDDTYETWLASFLAGTPETGIPCLKWISGAARTPFRKAMTESQDEIFQIRAAGFIVDGDDFYYPISINADVLATGFEKDDLALATAEFEKAATALGHAVEAFDLLHTKIVEAVG